MRYTVVNDVAGFRSQIARLAHGTNIDQSARAGREPEVTRRRQATDPSTLQRPKRRSVRMTAKAKRFLLKQEMLQRIRGAKYVLPRLIFAQRGVDSGKIVKIQLQRTISKPSLLGIAQLIAGKRNPGSRILIERFLHPRLNACLIVIAHDNGATQAANHLKALRRIRAVPHDVAQADQLPHSLSRDVGEHGFQRLQIAMNVGENCELHGMHTSNYAAASAIVNRPNRSDSIWGGIERIWFPRVVSWGRLDAVEIVDPNHDGPESGRPVLTAARFPRM